MRVDTENIVAIGDVAKQGGLSKLITRAESGRDLLFMRGSKPAAALVSVERIDRLEALEEEFGLLLLALTRTLTDDGTRVSLDDLISESGFTREELAEIDPDSDED